MSGLPCLRYGADSWRLPLSQQANDLIAAILLADRFDAEVHRDLVAHFRVDPPLMIFAALATVESVSGGHAAEAQIEFSVDQLATRFATQLSRIFSGGDTSLMPASRLAEDDAAWFTRLEKLRRSFVRLPIERWLPSAAKWLELVGPPVPRQWTATWPVIVDPKPPQSPADNPISYSPSKLDLAMLARRLIRSQSLLETFNDELQTAKRAAVKQFAYGLSHEINNPLANISTRAQTLMRGEAEPSRQQSLQRIVDQAMRAHEMTADLMFYAHPPTPKKTRFDLRDVVRTVAKQCEEAVRGRAIEMIVAVADTPATIDADRAMMTEAARSLLLNAIEAIGCDGRIVVGCEIEPDTSAAVMTVCDSGPGLSPAAVLHAFDPYFSGREAGRGLGVGLCRVDTITKIHGGDVRLSSGTVGCTARLWIPVSP
jgi:signal transduction histidine kinase